MRLPESEEYYIGWQGRAPEGIGSRVRRFSTVLLALVAGAAAVLAVSQRTIGVSVFEWGTVKVFTGILRAEPYPHLLVPRPGAAPDAGAYSSYYLVNPRKFGLPQAEAEEWDDRWVRLQGTLIYRGDQTMIEVRPGSLASAENRSESGGAMPPNPVQMGRQTLVGEIVDSKCYLGVMNPGNLIPHRACAIRCISGGVPPVLLVRRAEGPPLYYLIVSSEGRPVNKQVLDLVAEPVEITGEVTQQGNLLILRANPDSYKRARY